MKILYLFRHSTPEKDTGLASRDIPLSEAGRTRAAALPARAGAEHVDVLYSSPLRRAVETARYFRREFTVDERLAERDSDGPAPFTRELWLGQYTDPDLKNEQGESFREVRARMDAVIREILASMEPGQTGAAVTHAAAICAYLQQFCRITVLDPERKLRAIIHKEKTVLNGTIGTPSWFRLEFDGKDEPLTVTYGQ